MRRRCCSWRAIGVAAAGKQTTKGVAAAVGASAAGELSGSAVAAVLGAVGLLAVGLLGAGSALAAKLLAEKRGCSGHVDMAGPVARAATSSWCYREPGLEGS